MEQDETKEQNENKKSMALTSIAHIAEKTDPQPVQERFEQPTSPPDTAQATNASSLETDSGVA